MTDVEKQKQMEQIKQTKEQLLGYPYADKITLKIEEA